MFRRSLLCAATLAACGLAFPLAALAQAFPSKPIKLVIAFPAGGPTDITMRQLADNASKILGQPVIVDNKPGAGGTLPAQALQSEHRFAHRRWPACRCRCGARCAAPLRQLQRC